MGTGCKSSSHHLLRYKVRNRADDLQEMFDDLESAIKESRAADVAVLEEQVHQRLRECWAELNQRSPATSLQTLGLLQLSEEEDDATSKLAELAFGNTPKPGQVELQQADVGAAQGGRAANFQEEYYVNQNVVEQKLLYADHYESNLRTGPDNLICLEGGVVNHYNYQQYNMHQELPHDLYAPSAFLRPKCALWDCPRPAQGSERCQDYCSSFHATLAINEDLPGMTPVFRPGGIDLKDGPSTFCCS